MGLFDIARERQIADCERGAEGLTGIVRLEAGPHRAQGGGLGAMLSDLRVQRAQMPWALEGVIDREDEPHTFEELNADLDVRLDALKRGRTDWGCAGSHTGRYTAKQIEAGAPNCPQWRHHHHDAFCRPPSDMELRLAEVEKPETGWASRA